MEEAPVVATPVGALKWSMAKSADGPLLSSDEATKPRWLVPCMEGLAWGSCTKSRECVVKRLYCCEKLRWNVRIGSMNYCVGPPSSDGGATSSDHTRAPWHVTEFQRVPECVSAWMSVCFFLVFFSPCHHREGDCVMVQKKLFINRNIFWGTKHYSLLFKHHLFEYRVMFCDNCFFM